MNTKLVIGDANEHDAFLTNDGGWDVAILSRYTKLSHGVGCDEHIPHLLTDDQWQSLVNKVDAVDELVDALFSALSAINTSEDLEEIETGLFEETKAKARAVLAKLNS